MKPLLLLLKAIPAGARWITVHSTPDGGGQPILIQPQPDGSAKVIGGAGGSMNHLRLRSVKSEADYKADVEKGAKARAEAKKAQTVKDKAAGLVESKKAARAAVKSQQRKAQSDYVAMVAEAMGWSPESLAFDPSAHPNLSEPALNKLAEKHHRVVLEQANKAVEMVRQRLVNDADARQETGIGEIPLVAATPESLSVEDIAPIPPSTGGLGFSPDYKGRAEAQGLTPAALKTEAQATRPEKTKEERQAMIKKGETSAAVKAELAAIKEPILPDGAGSTVQADLMDARKAVDLLKARKKMLALQKQATAAKQEINKATTKPEPKAYVLEATEGVDDAAVKADIENDLRTASTTAFLSEYRRLAGDAPEETLGKHVGIGAFNSINSLALAVGGDALVDRSVVDVLGIAGAAQVLSRRLHTDMAEDMEAVTKGMEDYHKHDYMIRSEESLSQARDLMEAAKGIELGEASNGADLQVAQELNAKRRAAVNDAQKILGQALGEMEANAAIVVALKQGKKDSVQVSLGKTTAESAIQRARAIGLQKSDYVIDTAGGTTFLSINGAGMDRLAKPVSRDDVLQVKRNLSIINGDEDEQGWLPKGIANRPDLGLSVKPGVAPSLATPFTGEGDLHQGLSDYIGGRTADGDTSAAIMADIQSQSFFDKVGGRADEYRAALDKLAPLRGENGSMQRAEALDGPFNALADTYVKGKYGATRSPLNRQQVKIDDVTTEALHRALAEHPDGVAAYKQIGELSNQDQRALRETFHRDIARESPEAAGLRKDAEEHSKNEPETQEEDMFGEMTPNPEHAAWVSKRDDLSRKAGEASFDWNKYVKTMGSVEKAYESVQDTIKSRVGKSFVDAHNKLRPDAPIKVGRAVIRNNLNHLDATDPVARDARLAKERELTDSLRERSGGRYASGSVSDKLDSARDQREAFEQYQRGMFSSQDEDAPQPAAMAGDERNTLGHEAERQVASMMGQVGQNFKPGKPTKLFNPEMSTGKNVARQRLVRLVDANKRVTAAFGTGCVQGRTVLDDAEGRGWTFFQWWKSGERPTVFGLGSNGRLHRQVATPVFVKGISRMLHVHVAAGNDIVVTPDHQVYSKGRGWVKVADLLVGERIAVSFDSSEVNKPNDVRQTILEYQKTHLLRDEQQVFLAADPCVPPSKASVCEFLSQSLPSLPLTNSVHVPSVRLEDARHSFGRDANLVGRCHPSLCSCDEQLLSLSRVGQTLLTSPYDAQEHNHFCEHSGGSDHEEGRSHPCRYFGLLATLGSCLRGMNQWVGAQFRSASSSSKLFEGRSHTSGPDRMTSSAHRDTDVSAHQRGAVRFSSVVSVLPSGVHYVFDISVPNYNSYVANGMVHHNSGKTLLQMASFTNLFEQGKAKRGIFLVPSIVQGQFGGEALRFIDPNGNGGKGYNWHCQPGASRDERIAAYKNKDHHFVVMTHQSFRDDMLHLGSQHEGIDQAAMSEKLGKMTRPERKAWMHELMAREGIEADYTTVDESQNISNRAGKENSSQANVIDALGDNTPYLLHATADPVKSDASEAFDMMSKMDPDRYSDRGAFMRRYGSDTLASKDALKREMMRHLYPSKIDPDVKADRKTSIVPLSNGQKKAMGDLDKNLSKARMARMGGSVDIDAMKAISPGAFEGVPEADHDKLARELTKNIGILKVSAQARIINDHPDNAKIDDIVAKAGERKGRPGVVFARSLKAVKVIKDRLETAGHRVVMLTGADSGADKEKKRLAFNPESGEASADILVASDSGAVGMNAQRGSWMYQMDIPNTAMLSNQRWGRVYRTGQRSDCELIQGQADHASERVAAARLQRKGLLRDLMSSPMEGLDESGVAWYIQQQRIAALSGEDSTNRL